MRPYSVGDLLTAETCRILHGQVAFFRDGKPVDAGILLGYGELESRVSASKATNAGMEMLALLHDPVTTQTKWCLV